MPTISQIKALIRSYADGDDKNFYSVAMQIAASEARAGHAQAAQEIRNLIDSKKTKQAGRRLRSVVNDDLQGNLGEVLDVSYPKTRLNDLVVSDDVHLLLSSIISEHEKADEFRQYGFRPVRSVIFIGHSGYGKMFSAHVLAGELRLALFTIRTKALLEKPTKRLQLVVDAMQNNRGVYVLDVSNSTDASKAQRVVESLLDSLEQHDSSSIFICIADDLQIIGQDLPRCFGVRIRYDLLNAELRRRIIRNRLAGVSTGEFDWEQIDEVGEDLSQRELVGGCERAVKEIILTGAKLVTTEMVIHGLRR